MPMSDEKIAEDEAYWDEWGKPFGWELCGWNSRQSATFYAPPNRIIVQVDSRMHRVLTEVRRRLLALQEAHVDATAHLAGATSAYRDYVGHAGCKGKSDALYSTRLKDFEQATERAHLVALGTMEWTKI